MVSPWSPSPRLLSLQAHPPCCRARFLPNHENENSDGCLQCLPASTHGCCSPLTEEQTCPWHTPLMSGACLDATELSPCLKGKGDGSHHHHPWPCIAVLGCHHPQWLRGQPWLRCTCSCECHVPQHPAPLLVPPSPRVTLLCGSTGMNRLGSAANLGCTGWAKAGDPTGHPMISKMMLCDHSICLPPWGAQHCPRQF